MIQTVGRVDSMMRLHYSLLLGRKPLHLNTGSFLILLLVISTIKAYSPNCHYSNHNSNVRSKPFLAIITEPDACDNQKRMDETYTAIYNATQNNQVDLICIRVSPPTDDHGTTASITVIKNEEQVFKTQFQKRVVELTKRIVQLKHDDTTKTFHVVVNDNPQAAMEANADGIHVKERYCHQIPILRQQLTSQTSQQEHVIVGTSVHSVEAAMHIWKEYQPTYLFVGTCYKTLSHPEKDSAHLLEGPTLPGLVKQTILESISSSSSSSSCSDPHSNQTKDGNTNGSDADKVPIIFAIGGIDESNCHEPVLTYGADGVAVIRSVFKSLHPQETVRYMKYNMSETKSQ